MRITLSTLSASIDADLHDSGAGADFAALLPLTVQLTDFNGTEQIADLPRRLNITGEPLSAAATADTIAYYAPWGNLAIFYRDFPSSRGLVLLGTLRAAITDLVDVTDGGTVTVTAANL